MLYIDNVIAKFWQETRHNAQFYLCNARKCPICSCYLVIFGQPQCPKVWNSTITAERSVLHCLRQDSCRHSKIPAPLNCILSLPCPVEPSPSILKALHLCLRKTEKPLLVSCRIRRRIGVGICAFTLGVVFCRTEGICYGL